MPRNGSGTFTLVSGNPVVTGTTIESTWANTTLSDIATTLTDSLSRSGQGGMTAALRLADGTQSAPGVAFANETQTGFYRAGTGEVWAVVQGAQTLNLDANGVTVPSDKTTSIEGTFVFNETGADKDARFEGDTDANLLFIDASTDRVGVGTATPSNKLTVSGNADVTGNLGIGTSSPSAKLHVQGSQASGTANVLYLDNSSVTGTTLASVSFSNAGSVKASIAACVAGDGYMTFSNNNNTEKMRLDASGNLGLGVTPSAWAANWNALQVGQGNTSLVGRSDAFALYLGQNWRYDGADKYIGSAAASVYSQSGGQHAWYTAPSGTAGNAITFTQAMTLDASGQLSVGAGLAENSTGVYLLPTGEMRVKDNTENGTSQISIYNTNTTNDSEQFFVAMNGADVDIGNKRPDGGALKLFTFNTERARITSGGDLLVGTTSGVGERLRITCAANNQAIYAENTNATANGTIGGIYINYTGAAPNSTGFDFLRGDDTGANRFAMRSNGGLANYSANDVNLSDRREKTNFAPAKSYLDTICAIPVQTFEYIDQSEDDPGLTLGVVAQDVQAVAPELVMESNWGTEDNPKMRLSIYQTDLQYALMKCIQEQQALITALTARVAALEAA